MTAGLLEHEPVLQPTGGSRRPIVVTLVCVLAAAALAVAGTAGWLIGQHSRSGAAESSVDAGFARDMSTHHVQAIEMASYARDHSADPQIKILARDIETQQYFQVGEMQGWLDGWALSRSSTNAAMSWMSGHQHMQADGLMPGMASPAEMDRLETLSGTTLDVDFLQLMLRHHQGGLPMAQYAAAHAETDYVRNLAQKMADAQSNEIVQMEQLLRARGASPLAPPTG